MKDIYKIIEAGHKAPSADNCQPWYFKINGSTITIHHDKENTHANHIYNIDYFADYVSLGGVVENMSIQAKRLGYKSTVNLQCNENECAAYMSIEKYQESLLSDVHPMIEKRHTNRFAYHKKSISDEVKSFTKNVATEKGANLMWIDSPKKILKFSKIIASHDAILWQDEALRKNLIRMLRFGTSYPDGLSVSSLGLGIEQYFFKYIIKAARYFPPLWHIISVGSIIHTQKNIKQSAALGVLTLPADPHPTTYIKGGSALQSVWLELNKNRISVQPLFGPIAFMLNEQLGKGGLSKKHERIRKTIDQYFKKNLPQLKNETCVAFFRVGYAKKIPPVSNRRPLSEVIKN